MPRRKQPRPRFSLRGVMTVPADPREPAILHAAYPEAAQRALEGTSGIVLANPPENRPAAVQES